MSEAKTKEADHGIKAAYYEMPGRYPALECLCGEVFSDGCWEDAGAALDAHLHLNEIQ